MGDHLLSANITWNADDIRPDTMGFLAVAQMGRGLGQMDDKVLNGTFLWGDVVLRKFLFTYISLIINYLCFEKLLA